MYEALSAERKIIHIDMDAFFASVEQRDDPSLKGKPIAVGGDGARGVITTASYEARPFGVGSAMPGKVAKRKCPNLIFVPIRFEAYKEVSVQIRKIFLKYTDLVEPLSLDEAFLDVTKNKINEPSAIRVAQLIKEDIFKETKLTASAGVAGNKFLAKIASDLNKPSGLSVILPSEALEFIATLPVRKFFGVGPKTAAKMEGLGLTTGGDLQALSLNRLVECFGKSGQWYYDVVHNQDHRPVQPNRERKSVGIETTFEQDLTAAASFDAEIEKLTKGLWERMEKRKSWGRTLTLKVKFKDFTQITRSLSGDHLTNYELLEARTQTLWEAQNLEAPVRLLGLSVSNFKTQKVPKDTQQLSLL